MSAPLMSPGNQLPRSGMQRADITVRLLLLGLALTGGFLVVASLWLAGQVGGLLTHAAWPDSGPGDGLRIAFGIVGHPGDPRSAWPASARADLPPGWLLYPLWALLLAAMLTGVATPVLHVAKRTVRRRGFASHRDLPGSRPRRRCCPGWTSCDQGSACARATTRKPCWPNSSGAATPSRSPGYWVTTRSAASGCIWPTSTAN